MSSEPVVPQVVGHQEVMTEIVAAIATGCSHHALCLTGPKGIGKGLVAKLVGMAFLCPNTTLDGPCGTCRSCLRVDRGTHPDWHALQPGGQTAAGNIAVAKVREMEKELWLAPAEGNGRVALIEEAQLLREVGQNAILKTLEEPPPRTLFILLVPRASDLLPTVVSRCQVTRLKPLTEAEVYRVVQQAGDWSHAQIDEAITAIGPNPEEILSFLSGPGLRLLEIAEEIMTGDAQTLDAVELTGRVLTVEKTKSSGGGEGPELTPTQQKGRQALLFSRLLQQVAARQLRSSLLVASGQGAYDPTFCNRTQSWLELCIQAEKQILANLDPALTLEVLVLDLGKLNLKPS